MKTNSTEIAMKTSCNVNLCPIIPHSLVSKFHDEECLSQFTPTKELYSCVCILCSRNLPFVRYEGIVLLNFELCLVRLTIMIKSCF